MTITSELHSRGAAHQRAGTIDRELEREDSPAGRAYRDGMRQARREAEDGTTLPAAHTSDVLSHHDEAAQPDILPHRMEKEAAASTSPAPGSVEHTSANQPQPRPPQPATIFALPKPAKRPKKPASAAEQLDLL